MLQKTQKQSPFLGLWPILSSSSPPSINTPPNQKNTGADLKQLQKVCIKYWQLKYGSPLTPQKWIMNHQ